MSKKLNFVATFNKSRFIRQTIIVSGSILGIAIGLLLSNQPDDEVFVVGEILPDPEDATEGDEQDTVED